MMLTGQRIILYAMPRWHISSNFVFLVAVLEQCWYRSDCSLLICIRKFVYLFFFLSAYYQFVVDDFIRLLFVCVCFFLWRQTNFANQKFNQSPIKIYAMLMSTSHTCTHSRISLSSLDLLNQNNARCHSIWYTTEQLKVIFAFILTDNNFTLYELA